MHGKKSSDIIISWKNYRAPFVQSGVAVVIKKKQRVNPLLYFYIIIY